MMETNSTDEEKFPPEPLSQRAEKRKSPPKEYIGKLHYYERFASRFLEDPGRFLNLWLDNLRVFHLVGQWCFHYLKKKNRILELLLDLL